MGPERLPVLTHCMHEGGWSRKRQQSLRQCVCRLAAARTLCYILLHPAPHPTPIPSTLSFLPITFLTLFLRGEGSEQVPVRRGLNLRSLLPWGHPGLSHYGREPSWSLCLWLFPGTGRCIPGLFIAQHLYPGLPHQESPPLRAYYITARVQVFGGTRSGCSLGF